MGHASETVSVPPLPEQPASTAAPATSTPPAATLSLSVSTQAQTPPAEIPPRSSPGSGPIEEFLGPDNIPGMDAVEALADYLVGLRSLTSNTLSTSQATEICRLWNSLSDYDKEPTSFAPRRKKRLTKGRLKVKKSKTSVIPGLDSTKR